MTRRAPLVRLGGFWLLVASACMSNGSDSAMLRVPDACPHPAVEARCKDGWCEIPAGCFVMGSPEGEWGHPLQAENQVTVTLTRPFSIQQTEVTWEAWEAQGLRRDPSTWAKDASGGQNCLEPNCPVAHVTWFEAAAYANLLSERHDPPLPHCYALKGCVGELGSGIRCESAAATAPMVYDCAGFRLPTDAEWEYAARAGTKTAFYSGPVLVHGDYFARGTHCDSDPSLQEIGWYCHNSENRSHPVKGLAPNAWGLYDMAGNVGEWNNDRFDGLPARKAIDPGGSVELQPNRKVRGGSYLLWAASCRMANQSAGNWNLSRTTTSGFRLARTLR